MQQLLMKPDVRSALVKMDLLNHFKTAHIPNKKAAFAVFGMGLFIAIMPWVIISMLPAPDGEARGIITWILTAVALVGAGFVILPFIGLAMAKKQRAALEKDIARVEKHHGGIEKVAAEIKAHLAQEECSAHTIKSGHHLVKDWFFSAGLLPATRVVNLHDIVCIIGIMGAGTYLILSDGTEIETMFGGPKNWEDAFNLFTTANPYILTNENDDEVTTADGKVVNVETACQNNDIASITAAFERRKQSAENGEAK